MDRIYTKYFQEFIQKKIILISGPRQAGKTTITKMFKGSFQYLNYDDEDDRVTLREKSWDRKLDFVIFDELHKMKNWKRWLKGLFDKEGNAPSLVVTGSARLDTYKKTGDSLAGRFFQYRVHPLDVREICLLEINTKTNEVLDRLLELGGFPEPYLEGSTKFYHLWKKTHLNIILKQDLITQEDVKDIQSIELLIELLKSRVGSPVSYTSLAEDIQCSDKTIKHWLTILENMYVVFKIVPYSKNVARSVLKKPKFYFYDNARVLGDEGAKLENLVACSLLKECHFRQDCLGEQWDLFYLSKRGGVEIDFLITLDGKPHTMVEVKTSSTAPSKNFSVFSNDLGSVQKIQLVKNLKQEKTFENGVEIRDLANWLVRW